MRRLEPERFRFSPISEWFAIRRDASGMYPATWEGWLVTVVVVLSAISVTALLSGYTI